MLVRWFGHSSFLIITNGKKVLMDPYDPTVGYPMKFPQVEYITVSHEHFDHNYVNGVPGYKEVLKGNIEKELNGIKFLGIEGFHDDVKGKKRGKITLFKIEAEGITLAHLGDIGTSLSKSQIEKLGKINILMIPIGGVFTIGPKEAEAIIGELKPNIVLPMHYKTKYINLGLLSCEELLRGKTFTTHEALEVTKDSIPKPTQVYMLKLPF